MIILSRKNNSIDFLLEEFNSSIKVMSDFMKSHGYDTDEKRRRLLKDLRVDVPNVKFNNYYYLPGVIRLYIENINNTLNINSLSYIISMISRWPKEFKYDEDFNGKSVDEILRETNMPNEFFAEKNSYAVFRVTNPYEISKHRIFQDQDAIDEINRYIVDNKFPTYLLLHDGYTDKEYLKDRDNFEKSFIIVVFKNDESCAIYLRSGQKIRQNVLKKVIGQDLFNDICEDADMIFYDRAEFGRNEVRKLTNNGFPLDVIFDNIYIGHTLMPRYKVVELNGKKGVVDEQTNRLLLYPKYDRLGFDMTSYGHPYIRAHMGNMGSANEREGIYSLESYRWTIRPIYNDIRFIDGLRNSSSLWRLGRTDGKTNFVVISYDFVKCDTVVEGVDNYNKLFMSQHVIFNDKLMCVYKILKDGTAGLFGYDYHDTIHWYVKPGKYVDIDYSSFDEHRLIVVTDEHGKKGLIDPNDDEHVCLPCMYDNIQKLRIDSKIDDEGVIVKSNGKIGIVGIRSNDIVMPFKYDKLGNARTFYIKGHPTVIVGVIDGDKKGVYNITENVEMLPTKYNEICTESYWNDGEHELIGFSTFGTDNHAYMYAVKSETDAEEIYRSQDEVMGYPESWDTVSSDRYRYYNVYKAPKPNDTSDLIKFDIKMNKVTTEIENFNGVIDDVYKYCVYVVKDTATHKYAVIDSKAKTNTGFIFDDVERMRDKYCVEQNGKTFVIDSRGNIA